MEERKKYNKHGWAGLSLRWATNLSHRLGWLGLCIHVRSRECLVWLGKQVKLPNLVSVQHFILEFILSNHTKTLDASSSQTKTL